MNQHITIKVLLSVLTPALIAYAGKESQIQIQSRQTAGEIENLRAQLQAVDRRSSELGAAVAAGEQRIVDLSRERDALAARLQKSEQALLDSQTRIAQLRSISEERDAIAARLLIAEERYQTAQGELAKLGDQARREGRPQLQAHIRELSALVDQQRQELRRSEELLISDRDIRELMGARQLYIADVFDVSSDSRTRKPYGRVFYTRGKSLLFYAFDLDRQPGVRNASTFQVWGKSEPAQDRPVNLGVLYMDNEANRRWALRFDDPKQLAGIDAVFVTIEANAHASKPTGKPFLYASLRKEPNHP